MLSVIKYSCVGAAGVIILFLGREYNEQSNQLTPKTEVSPTVATTDATHSTYTSPHPASLPALRAREANGSNFTIGTVLGDTASYRRHFITYKSDNLHISGIMNIPKGAGPFPVLVLNHGFIDPAVYTNGRGLKREQHYLAERGYIVLHSDYRNHAASDKTDNSAIGFRSGYTEDVINAIDALNKAHLPFVDTSRVGMLGHSMGGGVALNVMVTKPNMIQAVALFAPVSSNMRDNYSRWIEDDPVMKAAVESEFGLPASNTELWDSLSAKTYIHMITMPVLIQHGTEDDSVPLEWSVNLSDSLKQASKDATLYTYPGEGHEFGLAWNQVMERTVTFFDRNIKNRS